MTKYVISGYIGFDNFGDEAIAKVLTDYLKVLNTEKITYISSNPKKTAELYGIDSVGMLKFIPEIKNCDVLISGGGSLLQDITSLKSLIYYLLVILTALVFKKKVLIFAQGFTPFRTRFGQFLALSVLKHCHEITVRDAKSQEYLDTHGIKSKLISDPVFAINPSNNLQQNKIGIQLRAHKGLTEIFLEELANKVVKYFPNKDIRLISLQDSLDLDILQNFKEKLSSRGLQSEIVQNLSINDTIKELASLEYLIAMRFHACLVSAKSGVKTLGINYDEKVKKLANEMGFCTIELNDTDFSSSFENLINSNPQNYILPKFSFENITLLHSQDGY